MRDFCKVFRWSRGRRYIRLRRNPPSQPEKGPPCPAKGLILIQYGFLIQVLCADIAQPPCTGALDQHGSEMNRCDPEETVVSTPVQLSQRHVHMLGELQISSMFHLRLQRLDYFTALC